MGKIKTMNDSSTIFPTIAEIEEEIAEYQIMIRHAIQTNDKGNLNMWRRALQTAKNSKRRLANS